MLQTLKGRTAVVTGGGGGIGRETCVRLAEAGAAVAVLDIDESAANETVGLLRASGVAARAFTVDVSRCDDVRNEMASVQAWTGAIDILVNNAGIVSIARLEDCTEEEWGRTFAVNVQGAFHCCKAVLPLMRSRGFGRIVNMSSWLGKSGRPYFAAYSASKAAVIGLTQALALEVADAGITVNAICPGTIAETDMRSYADRAGSAWGLPTAKEREGAIPLGRLGRPADVAAAVGFLVSDDAQYMTGQALNVTGGLWMH